MGKLSKPKKETASSTFVQAGEVYEHNVGTWQLL